MIYNDSYTNIELIMKINAHLKFKHCNHYIIRADSRDGGEASWGTLALPTTPVWPIHLQRRRKIPHCLRLGAEPQGMIALHLAAARGHLEVVEALLDSGVAVNAADVSERGGAGCMALAGAWIKREVQGVQSDDVDMMMAVESTDIIGNICNPWDRL